jgi:osmotically-inducible protein OsmY
MTRLAWLACLVPLMILQGCELAVLSGGAAAISAIEDRRTAGTILDDDGIESHVRRAVRERYGENTHVNVTSFNRSVLLTGEIPEQARREELEKIVLAIANVRGVTNELQVAAISSLGSRANDSLITTKVKGRLLDANKVNPIHVKVVTEAGVVYLMGVVTEQEGADAVDIARNTGGVIKVVKIFEYCKSEEPICRPRQAAPADKSQAGA